MADLTLVPVSSLAPGSVFRTRKADGYLYLRLASPNLSAGAWAARLVDGVLDEFPAATEVEELSPGENGGGLMARAVPLQGSPEWSMRIDRHDDHVEVLYEKERVFLYPGENVTLDLDRGVEVRVGKSGPIVVDEGRRAATPARWITDGSLPLCMRLVLVAVTEADGPHTHTVAVGYHADEGCPWVIPGVGVRGGVAAWSDCLGDDFEAGVVWPGACRGGSLDNRERRRPCALCRKKSRP